MTENIFKEPLLHFLLIGFGIFMLASYSNKNIDLSSQTEITVNKDRLLIFMQNRAKQFDEQKYNKIFENLNPEHLQSLINEYVLEEALFREAKALKLDQNDYVARRRLILQLKYITRGFISSDLEPSEKELTQFLKEHKNNYEIPANITFTHVFFSTKSGDKQSINQIAQQKLFELNNNQVLFHQAISHGQHFLYHRNYIKKDAEEITSHFGETMSKELFKLKSDFNLWLGPYTSPYGYHLVLVTAHNDTYLPSLNEIKQNVIQDFNQYFVQKNLDKALLSIVENYHLNITDNLKTKILTTAQKNN